MSRDKVKTELGHAVRQGVQGYANSLAHRLREHNVVDVETQMVSELETQVKVIFMGMPPRYFLVKLSEKF
jgi:hypothetical protein